MEKATKGLEVDILRRALADYSLHFTQLSNKELQTAVQEGRADVAATVQPEDGGVFYSRDFLTFANYAISKKADGLKIDHVADLKNHQVLTWQNAYLELGDEFEGLFSPGSPQRKNYVEVADQREQVRMFWQGTGDIIVIDRSIFSYFSKEMGHSISEVDLHSPFPAVTNFKVSFKEAAVRDSFDQGLRKLCQSGAYAELLDHYGIVLQSTVCD